MRPPLSRTPDGVSQFPTVATTAKGISISPFNQSDYMRALSSKFKHRTQEQSDQEDEEEEEQPEIYHDSEMRFLENPSYRSSSGWSFQHERYKESDDIAYEFLNIAYEQVC